MYQLDQLKNKIYELSKSHAQLIDILIKNCWNIKRSKTKKEHTGGFELIDLSTETVIERKIIPPQFFSEYRRWYSLGKGILEVNYDKESMKEFTSIYDSIFTIHKQNYMCKREQLELVDLINHQLMIIESLPAYLEGKTHSLKLTIASTLMGDELKEARLLLANGFTRAAGALAGVILERHLKLRFDNANPRIKYGEKATLGQLIHKADEINFFENSLIQKLQYLNPVRISCDHDKKNEPKENEVKDLIEQTDRFIHFIKRDVGSKTI